MEIILEVAKFCEREKYSRFVIRISTIETNHNELNIMALIKLVYVNTGISNNFSMKI